MCCGKIYKNHDVHWLHRDEYTSMWAKCLRFRIDGKRFLALKNEDSERGHGGERERETETEREREKERERERQKETETEKERRREGEREGCFLIPKQHRALPSGFMVIANTI